VFVLVWLLGRYVHDRAAESRWLRDRTAHLELTREERAQAAVADERSRISRELHDIIAHSVSVMVLQARGGRRMLDVAPADARTAFDSIESTGRQALNEMRRLVGILRSADEPGLEPLPSMRHLDALVARVQRAGLPVEVTIEGTTPQLPAGVDLSAYRIVQQALANTLEATRRIDLAADSPSRVLVLTTFDLDEYVFEALRTGASGFLLKDAPEDQLVTAIRVGTYGQGTGGVPADGAGAVQHGDCGKAVPERAHGPDPRRAHSRQARSARPGTGRRPRLRIWNGSAGRRLLPAAPDLIRVRGCPCRAPRAGTAWRWRWPTTTSRPARPHRGRGLIGYLFNRATARA